MPTQRKRIGFLPRLEVHNIIDKICKDNKLSQSKVTGILVEEALIFRGILNTYEDNLSMNLKYFESESSLLSNKGINNEGYKKKENIFLDECESNDEVEMINNFIQYKFFKKIMVKNKKII